MATPPDRRPLRVHEMHAMPGRLRLRVLSAIDRADAGGLADRVAACACVTRVQVRPGTGSIIVEGGVPAADLRAALEAAGLVQVVPLAPAIPVAVAAKMGMDRLDRTIAERTDGALDHRSALALLLFAGAAIQLYRGHIAGPAATLLMAALSLIEPPKR